MTTEVITIDQQISLAVSQFTEPEEAIAQMRVQYMAMTLQSHGIGTITDARKATKRLRLAIEERRKELKEDSLKYGRAVDSRAKELATAIAPIEAHLQEQEEIHEKEKARVKAEKESARRAVLNDRIGKLVAVGAAVDAASVEMMSDETFANHLQQETLLAEERRRLLEVERIERERLEQEREAERKRQEQEMLAEKERLAEERRKMELEQAELRKARAAIDAENRARQEAENKRLEDERLAKVEAERIAKIERLKPVVQQFDGFALDVLAVATARVIELGNPDWSERVMWYLRNAMKEIRSEIENG